MSTTKKVLFTVFTVLLVGALTFLIIWGVTNFNKVQEGLSGTGLYTKEDVDNAYRDGYNMALFDKGAFEEQITELRNELTEKQAEVDALKNVEADNADLKNIIALLEQEIANLNKTIIAYEEFIKEVEESNKVIATFMIDGAAYEMHSYTPGQAVTFPAPADEYCRVNSWSVNAEAVDVTNYVITENTTFVADVTFPYVVTFVSNGAEHDEIICYPGESFELPAEPVAEFGYVFAGWSIDNKTVVDVATLPEANVTYYAVFDIETVALKLTYSSNKYMPGITIYYFNIESSCDTYTTNELIDLIANGSNFYYANKTLAVTSSANKLKCSDANLQACGMGYGDILNAVDTGESIYINVTFIKG